MRLKRLERQTITPQQASIWLSANTVNYRRLAARTVGIYAADMTAGRWKYTHAAIIIDKDGRVLDGQHRLAAIVESGVSIVCDVVLGADPDIVDWIDIGRGRRPTDMAQRVQLDNAHTGCAIARMLILHDAGIMLGPTGKYSKVHVPSPPAILERFSQMNEQIQKAVRATLGCRTLLPPSVAGFCFILFAELDEEMACRFFSFLGRGAGYEESSGVHRLRERLIDNRGSRSKLTQQYMIALTIKAWNYFVFGRKMRFLRWSEGEPFPVPIAPGAPEPVELGVQ